MEIFETSFEQVSNGYGYSHIEDRETWTCLVHKIGTAGNMTLIGLGYRSLIDGEIDIGIDWTQPVFIGSDAWERASEYYDMN